MLKWIRSLFRRRKVTGKISLVLERSGFAGYEDLADSLRRAGFGIAPASSKWMYRVHEDLSRAVAEAKKTPSGFLRELRDAVDWAIVSGASLEEAKSVFHQIAERYKAMPENKPVYATPEQKLDIARKLIERFDELCREARVVEDPEIMALALTTLTGDAGRYRYQGQIKLVIEG